MRMLCTECLYVGEPDTRLEGSDRLELLGWLCLALPGLLYCWWRHLQRCKVCPECGSDQLMRESRASVARRIPQAPAPDGTRVVQRSHFAWPRALGSTRARLRTGGCGALAAGSVFGAWLLGALEVTSGTQALQAASATGLLSAAWLARQLQQLGRRRQELGSCEAWDEQGRVLRIERI